MSKIKVSDEMKLLGFFLGAVLLVIILSQVPSCKEKVNDISKVEAALNAAAKKEIEQVRKEAKEQKRRDSVVIDSLKTRLAHSTKQVNYTLKRGGVAVVKKTLAEAVSDTVAYKESCDEMQGVIVQLQIESAEKDENTKVLTEFYEGEIEKRDAQIEKEQAHSAKLEASNARLVAVNAEQATSIKKLNKRVSKRISVGPYIGAGVPLALPAQVGGSIGVCVQVALFRL
jgi:hypothetical protein